MSAQQRRGAAAGQDGAGSVDGGVASVAKAFAVLDLIGERGPTTFGDLVAETGLPKSTLFRLLTTIIECGYAERSAHGEYSVTVKLWRLGAKAINYSLIHPHVLSTLRQIVDATSETAHFSIYDDGCAVYVEKVEGTHPIHAYTSVGGRSPAYASATGKALLAYRPPAEIERVGRHSERHTPTTIRDAAALLDEMALVRKTGIAVNRGEWREGVWGVAAPVVDHRGEVAGAIGLSGPRDRIEPAVQTLSILIASCATALTERYGGAVPSSAKR
jgi:DNA-binding IclR family transcriptional regulator